LRGGGDDFVTPVRVTAFCEKLFFVGWEPGIIVYFVLRNTILTSITETVRGEGPGGGASLDYALKETMIQLDADLGFSQTIGSGQGGFRVRCCHGGDTFLILFFSFLFYIYFQFCTFTPDI